MPPMKCIGCILLVSCLSLSACSSGGDGFVPSQALLAAAQCTGASLEDLNEVFQEVLGFMSALGGTLPGSVTYDDQTGDFTITTVLGPVTGTVTSADNIDDGLDQGESAGASWALNGGLTAGAAVLGEGLFNVSRPLTNELDVSGNASLSDGTCDFSALTLVLTIDLSPSGDGPAGSLEFDAMTPGGDMAGTMTFDGSDIARVNGQFDGAPFNFRLDLNNFVPIF